MKAKEILVLILILVAGVTFYFARTGRLNWSWDGEWGWWGEEYSYEETRTIEPPFASLLELSNSHGNVIIQGTDEEKITLTLEKAIWRNDEKEAKEIADRLHPVVTAGEIVLKITTNRDDFRKRNFETHFKLSVPKNIAIEVKNSYGAVEINRLRKAGIENRHGRVAVFGIEGDLNVWNSYENLEVESVEGNCRIDGKHSDATVLQVKGETILDHSYGTVRLEEVGRGAKVTTAHSEVHCRRISGPVEIRGSYKDISLVDSGPAVIQGHHSPITAEEINGRLEIRDNYASVRVSNIRGDLKIDGKNLEVSGNSIDGQEIFVSSSYKDIGLQDFSGKTTVLLSHGDMTLSPKSNAFPLEARNTYGGILFYWPAGERNPVEAQVKGGEVHWNLAEELSSEKKNGLSVVKAFSGEKERPALFFSTTYADIRIEPK